MTPEPTIRQQGGDRIAVIGCGLAGLTAARALSDLGHSVHCFDKGRGVGGRTSVRRAEGFEFDHGAQYFTIRDQRLAGQLQSWLHAGIVAEWTGWIVDLHDGVPAARQPQKRFVGVPGMTALAKHLASGLNITTQTRIDRIEFASGSWHLTAEAGEIGQFDRLILSIPAEQARTLLQHHPVGLSHFQSVHMQPCWAVMCGFDRAIAADFDGAFVKNSPLSWIARNNSKPGRPAGEAWVLHASPEWSAAHLEDNSDAITEALTREFARQIGHSPAPVFAAAHRWRYARSTEPLHSGAIVDESLKLTICGDWCAGDRVEGALLSGLCVV